MLLVGSSLDNNMSSAVLFLIGIEYRQIEKGFKDLHTGSKKTPVLSSISHPIVCVHESDMYTFFLFFFPLPCVAILLFCYMHSTLTDTDQGM